MRFREALDVEFPENQVTLISGENGAGKTSILDALCVCLYGRTSRTEGRASSGFLGVNDLVNHAVDRATIRVEFENHGHNYVANRTITKNDSTGELFEDGESKAVGHRVFDYVRSRAIGLDWEGFRRSTIILQGEMSALTEMDPGKRKGAFVKLFGLGVYDDYEKAAHEKSKEKQSTIGQIEEANKILSADIQKIPGIVSAIRKLKVIVSTLGRRKVRLYELVERRRREKDMLEGDHDRYLQLRGKLSGLDNQIAGTKRRLGADRKELGRILALSRKFPQLRESYREFTELDGKLAQQKPTKEMYDGYEKRITSKVAEMRSTKKGFSEVKAEIRTTKNEIRTLTNLIPSSTEISRVKGALHEAETREKGLARDQEKWKATIRHDGRAIKDLRQKLGQVRGKKRCPVCLQKIADPTRVIRHYAGEIRTLSSEREEAENQLGKLRKDIEAIERKLEKLGSEKERLDRRAAKGEQVEREKARLKTLDQQASTLEGDIARVGNEIKAMLAKRGVLGFDEKEYDVLERKLGALRRNKVAERFATTKRDLDRLPSIKCQISESEKELDERMKERGGYALDVKKLGNIESRFDSAKTRFDNASDAYAGIDKTLSNRSLELENSRKELGELRGREKMLKDNLGKIKQLSQEKVALEELRTIFKAIPENILRRLRPSIEKEGTDIINDLSNSEITALNIEDNTLNVAATTNGVVRPIQYYSGGQKTRINMALRVAVSRILSLLPQTEEHAFAVMQTLFIDEGEFGTLDETGINDVVEVVRNLAREFNRVILVSHVDAIKDIFEGYTLHVLKTGAEESKIRILGSPADEQDAMLV